MDLEDRSRAAAHGPGPSSARCSAARIYGDGAAQARSNSAVLRRFASMEGSMPTVVQRGVPRNAIERTTELADQELVTSSRRVTTISKWGLRGPEPSSRLQSVESMAIASRAPPTCRWRPVSGTREVFAPGAWTRHATTWSGDPVSAHAVLTTRTGSSAVPARQRPGYRLYRSWPSAGKIADT